MGAIEFHHMKVVKEEMEPLKKMSKLRMEDTRYMQKYMKQKSLSSSRIEFLWQTNMIDTRMNMNGEYEKDKY